MEVQAMNSKSVIRMLRREVPGAKVEFGGSGHLKLRLPNGKLVTVSATPSGTNNFLRAVRGTIKRQLRKGVL
jgi:hypothetical protein